MKILYCLAAAVVAALAVPPESNPLREFTNGNLQFTANTYKELAQKNVGKNFLVCPLSVAVILALTEAGAGGQTAQQLITGLNLPATEENIHQAMKSLSPSLNVNSNYTLASANKIYLKKGYKLKQQFKDVATQVFNSKVDEIDFLNKAVAAKKMNKWVLEQTHDKIKDLVSEGDLHEDTRLVLINAIYFHAQWANQFDVEGTSEKPFIISSTREAKVKMMDQTDWFNYDEDLKLNAKFLEMKYLNSPLSMVFVLPNNVDGLTALEEHIHEVVKPREFNSEEVHVQIPHVHIEDKIEFIPILKKLGITDPFDDSKADFSRLLDKYEPLVISKILQKTFIEIEEKGTKAAAATEVILQLAISAQLPSPPPKQFEANHPFIFILKSEEGILFIGRYVGPDN